MTDDQSSMRSIITPDDQTLRKVFNTQKAYYIDIYQREYKWAKENVDTLLNDFAVQFELTQRTKTDPRDIQTEVLEKFEPYFLNTYLTHSTAMNVSIVDGQQRLTTLLLILIKFYRILQDIESDGNYSGTTFNSEIISKLIFESDDFGQATRFKIYNENREEVFRNLVEDREIHPTDETQRKIKENYQLISNYYDKFLAMKDVSDRYDLVKLTYYITYLLDRVSIVEIKIEKQKNVAMIFEVVNDRGLGLKPYEILKGKLLGNLPQQQKEHANTVWTKLQNDYFNAELKNSTESKIDLDMFFQTYFRAKFADTENDYDKFEADYHYEIYRDKNIRKYFKDFKDPTLLYQRIITEIKYFAELYLWLRTSYENEYLIYNKMLDQNQQYLLILSCVTYDDINKGSKINDIAKKFDLMHTLLRLMNVYESTKFQRIIYPLNKDIRNQEPENAVNIFDDMLIKTLEDEEAIARGEIKSVEEIFTFERFKGISNKWTNFSKYVLMRIDRYLSKLLDEKPSYTWIALTELEERFNKTTRRKLGMHLEHIYAWNESNMAQFTVDGKFDDDLFNTERNKLGMVLLLKDRQNISSGNEIYTDKIETYKTSNFIWNELLTGHLHSIDLREIPDDLRVNIILPNESGSFPKKEIENRQRLVFNAIKRIWQPNI
jgi:uncharacterized protein with ParB-like and HNH nuclease domain